jgi:hypothetical protein
MVAPNSFLAIQQLVRGAGPRRLGLQTAFVDDTLSYFTERLDPACTRRALIDVVHRAKRNKAFENSRWVGLFRRNLRYNRLGATP